MNPSQDATGLATDDPAIGWRGRIGRTLAESTPDWPTRPAAPEGAPNIVVILLDDLGYSDFGCFGAEIRTAAIDRLAARGLRFANYTTVPMCTPARAALLTGKNPHSVGCGWLTFNDPGFPGYRSGEMTRDTPTLAEILRGRGYSTYAVGKWHNTAESNVSPSAERSSWPLQRGFDRFYGFLGGETHYFAPAQLVEDNAFLDHATYPDGYYCTDDWTDKAIGWLKEHAGSAPGKPFFLYVAHNAPHAPLHAIAADLARYRGAYDEGWDVLRERRVARQVDAGLFAAPPELPAHTPGVPAWETLDPGRKAIAARYMELYAAVVDNLDQNIGRLVDTLEALGCLDNTVIVLTSDNGANGIGGPDGAANNLAKRLGEPEDPAWVRSLFERGGLGAADSWPAYPLGWTDVSAAPFRLYKTTTMNGGIRVPLVVHWPKGITDPGAVRTQWVHVTDIAPTLLDCAGVRAPDAHAGFRTRPMDGRSFRAMLAEDGAPSIRREQHYELAGNRGYILDGWKLVSLQPPGKPMALDNWQLYDLRSDPTECHDLAEARPDKLRELIGAFETDASANYVYPLDNRGVRRSLTVPPYLEASLAEPRTFYPGTGTVALSVIAPMIADRSYRLACEFEWSRGARGVIFALGDPIAGLALHARDGQLEFVCNSGSGRVAACTLAPVHGHNRFDLSHRALGRRRGEGTITLNGGAPLLIEMSPTTILGLGVGEGLDIGCDRRLHVTDRYEGRDACRYDHAVAFVTVEPGPQAPDSYANRPERLAQRD